MLRLFLNALPIEGVTRGLALALPAIDSLAKVGTVLSAEAIKAELLGGIVPASARLSANAIIRQVRAMGFAVQRQAALKVIRQVRAQVDARAYVSQLRPSSIPLASELPFTPYRMAAKYHYRVLVTGHDQFTGESRAQWVTVSSDRLISREQAEFFAVALVTPEANYELKEIEDVHLDMILRNPAFGTLT